MRMIAMALGAALLAAAAAAENRIDVVRPDAPELAKPGPNPVGVRTLTLVNPGQIDIVNVKDGALPTYDRALTVEVWYPAAAAAAGDGRYEGVLMRDGQTAVTLVGRAQRDAAPATGTAHPVVIVSHGYPGNRFLLSPLAENLATKGYVVVSIDHRESTYDDRKAFGSTLVNRPLDTKFVLSEIARLSADPASFLSGIADASNAALIGYSMGGYGAVISAGGGVTEASTAFTWGAPAGTLKVHLAGSETHKALMDPRFRAFVAFAPWGMQRGFWDAEGLKGIDRPILFIAGSIDDVSGYEKGTKALFEGAVNAERYLLTLLNANHNAAAPMPAPAESWAPTPALPFIPFDHYADPVWDSVRMNNIAQHFVTAFVDWKLKGDAAKADYLKLTERSIDGVWSVDDKGNPKPDFTYWKGFQNRTAAGLEFRAAMPGN